MYAKALHELGPGVRNKPRKRNPVASVMREAQAWFLEDANTSFIK